MNWPWFVAGVAVSLLMGYCAGVIGARNGRNFNLCFLWGFFLGVIGVLVVYAIGAPRRATADGLTVRPTGESRSRKKKIKVCRACGKLIEEDSIDCRYCGADTSRQDGEYRHDSP